MADDELARLLGHDNDCPVRTIPGRARPLNSRPTLPLGYD